MKKLPFLIISTLIFYSSCNKATNEGKNENDTITSVSDTLEKKSKVSLNLKWTTDTTLTTCESVFYDKERNILYVSNINGKPTDKDKNGFISKLTTEGKIENLKWVTGINAPKGMGVFNGKLYVTDISALVEIDIEKGKILKRYEIPGATFLNDVTISEDGTVYFSDSDTGKIHTLKNGKVEEWKGGFQRPNGLLSLDTKLFLATSQSSDFRIIDIASKKDSVIATGIGAGDGVVSTGKPGEFFVSNWNGEIFYIGADGQTQKVLDTKDQKMQTADIGYIQDQNLLLVPTFFGNKVMAYEVKF